MDTKILLENGTNELEVLEFELVIRVLQTHALPLGYVAIEVTPTGIEPVLPP